MVVVMNIMMMMMMMMMMAIAEKFDTAATIAYANEEIREILHRMEGSLQIANKDEQSTMIQALKILYPQVTWQEFYEMGAQKDVIQWNKGFNGNYNRQVSLYLYNI
jgi:hypothetical protein